MRRAPPPTAEELALFRAAVGPVRELEHDAADVRARPPPPDPKQSRADEQAVRRQLQQLSAADVELALGDTLAFTRDGVASKILRQLGKGQFSVRAELDLHRMTVRAATTIVGEFLAQQRQQGNLCVKIIHGKGLRSGDSGPVLKQLTDRLLRQHGAVLAFRSARAADGGTGAVIVLLRAAQR